MHAETMHSYSTVEKQYVLKLTKTQVSVPGSRWVLAQGPMGTVFTSPGVLRRVNSRDQTVSGKPPQLTACW